MRLSFRGASRAVGHESCKGGGGLFVPMLTDEKTDLVACANVPKHMGSEQGSHDPSVTGRKTSFETICATGSQ